MLNGHQHCPHCHGAIATENFAHEVLIGTGREVTLLYCDFCDYGIETLWRVIGTGRLEEFSLEFNAAEPTKLGQFQQRLKDRRAA